MEVRRWRVEREGYERKYGIGREDKGRNRKIRE